MDPITALGSIASVITIVETSFKAIKTGRDIYCSVNGLPEANSELLSITDQLQGLYTNLTDTGILPSGLHQAHEIKHVVPLAKEASEIARELQSKLLALKTDSQSKWDIVKKSAKTVWSKDQVANLEHRLSRLNQNIHIFLSQTIRQEIERTSEKLDALAWDQKNLHSQSINELRGLQSELLSSISASRTSTTVSIDEIKSLTHRLMSFTEVQECISQEQHLLSSLNYESISSRRNKITSKSGKTFEWIFDQTHGSQRLHFNDWLSSENGIFWISGKAGCGKSTLMKWLSTSTLTNETLQKWTGPVNRKLVVGSFFMWYTGNDIDRSQAGLLRSLLLEVFLALPELRSIITQTVKMIPNNGWSLDELVLMFESAVSSAADTASFCFFIDGLDEYDGSMRDISDNIVRLSEYANVKFCISSRPWTVFEAQFGQQKRRTLALHEHTYEDIEMYAESILGRDHIFEDLVQRNARHNRILTKLVEKAQGVFLWIVLVIRFLRDSLADGNDPTELEKKLDEFPDDLESYFQRMLDNIPKHYQAEASQILLMLVAYPWALPLLMFRFIGPEIPAADQSRPQTLNELQDQEAVLKTRLKARTVDLVEFTSQPYYTPLTSTVDFLHKTIYDFLKQVDTLKYLHGKLNKPFDPVLALLRAHAEALKTYEKFHDQAKPDCDIIPWKHQLNYFAWGIIDIADRCVTSDQTEMLAVLDETNRSFARLDPHHVNDSYNLYVILDSRNNHFLPIETRDLLHMAIQYRRVKAYVQHCFQRDRKLLERVGNYSPLTIFLDNFTTEPQNEIDYWVFLLEQGASPNAIASVEEENTVWFNFLKSFPSIKATKKRMSILEVVACSSIQYGADMRPLTGIGAKGEQTTIEPAVALREFFAGTRHLENLETVLERVETANRSQWMGW
ncbi:hypothetical protein FH972_024201 [Carpinus fangiana]|uniref:NACHT domain-containing protein n=1 Tax=Carpinus fangiana TaxID=176857 RepID=A0A5N6KXC8_9ROSI|nr:hypothetical protein FH972_024201 [Carpinus fangiana]